MSDKHSITVKISSSDGRNVVEQFYNTLVKNADRGQTEFGVDIEVERVREQSEEQEGFE